MDVRNPEFSHDYLSAAEAAALLPSTSAQTVLRWAKDGLLPYIELPGSRARRKFFLREDIEQLLTPKVASSPSSAASASSPDEVSQFVGQEVLPW